MLNNIKTKERGFTIVELLIVIVVIAILAAISIVAYNGIQNRGKSASAQSLAGQISKKVEAWNTVQSSYPSFCQLATNTTNPTGTAPSCTAGSTTGPAEAKLDDASKLSTSEPANESTVGYKTCSGGGAQLSWRDASASVNKYVGVGGASSSPTATAWC